MGRKLTKISLNNLKKESYFPPRKELLVEFACVQLNILMSRSVIPLPCPFPVGVNHSLTSRTHRMSSPVRGFTAPVQSRRVAWRGAEASPATARASAKQSKAKQSKRTFCKIWGRLRKIWDRFGSV